MRPYELDLLRKFLRIVQKKGVLIVTALNGEVTLEKINDFETLYTLAKNFLTYVRTLHTKKDESYKFIFLNDGQIIPVLAFHDQYYQFSAGTLDGEKIIHFSRVISANIKPEQRKRIYKLQEDIKDKQFQDSLSEQYLIVCVAEAYHGEPYDDCETYREIVNYLHEDWHKHWQRLFAIVFQYSKLATLDVEKTQENRALFEGENGYLSLTKEVVDAVAAVRQELKEFTLKMSEYLNWISAFIKQSSSELNESDNEFLNQLINELEQAFQSIRDLVLTNTDADPNDFENIINGKWQQGILTLFLTAAEIINELKTKQFTKADVIHLYLIDLKKILDYSSELQLRFSQLAHFSANLYQHLLNSYQKLCDPEMQISGNPLLRYSEAARLIYEDIVSSINRNMDKSEEKRHELESAKQTIQEVANTFNELVDQVCAVGDEVEDYILRERLRDESYNTEEKILECRDAVFDVDDDSIKMKWGLFFRHLDYLIEDVIPKLTSPELVNQIRDEIFAKMDRDAENLGTHYLKWLSIVFQLALFNELQRYQQNQLILTNVYKEELSKVTSLFQRMQNVLDQIYKIKPSYRLIPLSEVFRQNMLLDGSSSHTSSPDSHHALQTDSSGSGNLDQSGSSHTTAQSQNRGAGRIGLHHQRRLSSGSGTGSERTPSPTTEEIVDDQGFRSPRRGNHK